MHARGSSLPLVYNWFILSVYIISDLIVATRGIDQLQGGDGASSVESDSQVSAPDFSSTRSQMRRVALPMRTKCPTSQRIEVNFPALELFETIGDDEYGLDTLFTSSLGI